VADPDPRDDQREPRRPKYIEALLQDFNLIGLGGTVALAAVTQNPIPLIIGAAVEALYLINAPGSTWFERYLAVQRARRRARRRQAWRTRTLAGLPRADRERFRATQRRLASSHTALDQETRLLAVAELDRVDDLLDQMLDLLTIRVSARAYLSTVDVEALVEEVRQVKRRIRETEHPDLLKVEEQRLDVLEKRLHEYREMQKNVEIVTSQVATIEHSVAYLADKLVSWSAAGREPQGLKEILAGVESTEEAMEQVRPAMEQIQRVRQS
jgi:pimeloyl-ACP methyl ester carboxylesterase